MVRESVTRVQHGNDMDTAQRTNEQMITLLRAMQEDWQHATEFGVRGLWYESGQAQGRAEIALEQVIEALSARGQ